MKKANEKKEYPLVTIVTIVFNGEKSIERAIDSVRKQTYRNIEYIVIDGLSNDNTVKIIKNNSEVVDILISEKDNGISDAFNKGVKAASGDLICMLNADDWYEKSAIENFVDAYRKENSTAPLVIYGKTHRIKPDGSYYMLHQNEDRDWCLTLPFSHCSCVLNKEYYKKFGLYSESFKIAMDVDLLFRGFRSAKYIGVDRHIANQAEGGVSDVNRISGYIEYMDASCEYCGWLKRYTFYYYKICIVIFRKIWKK